MTLKHIKLAPVVLLSSMVFISCDSGGDDQSGSADSSFSQSLAGTTVVFDSTYSIDTLVTGDRTATRTTTSNVRETFRFDEDGVNAELISVEMTGSNSVFSGPDIDEEGTIIPGVVVISDNDPDEGLNFLGSNDVTFVDFLENAVFDDFAYTYNDNFLSFNPSGVDDFEGAEGFIGDSDLDVFAIRSLVFDSNTTGSYSSDRLPFSEGSSITFNFSTLEGPQSALLNIQTVIRLEGTYEIIEE